MSTPSATLDIESCIEAFAARRCMFESNFPVDSGTTQSVLCNAYKRLAMGAPKEAQAELFSETARVVYRLDY
jgi:L-fuconolactonase